jgi:hypothetical protein
METKQVYSKIALIAGTLAKTGISKNKKNSQQGYMYRGIDDVYSALAPLLSEYGLVVLPRYTERINSEKESKSGGVLFYSVVRGEFDFIDVADGSCHTVVTYGEAMDSADKSTNKAMSAAYKYACFQAFSIPTEGDNDADKTTHEVKPSATTYKKPAPSTDVASEPQRKMMWAIFNKTLTDAGYVDITKDELSVFFKSYLSELVDHEVISTNEFTKKEASLIIDTMTKTSETIINHVNNKMGVK